MANQPPEDRFNVCGVSGLDKIEERASDSVLLPFAQVTIW